MSWIAENEKDEILKKYMVRKDPMGLMVSDIMDLEKELAKVKAELGEERKVVDWYADRGNWFDSRNGQGKRCIRRSDVQMVSCEGKWGGRRARERQKAREVE